MRTDAECLADILDAVQRIRRHVKARDQQRFGRDEVLQSAVLGWFEIIGEASRGLTDQFRQQHPDVPWRAISGFRNVVAHGYMGVDMERVWEYLTTDLPALRQLVERELG